MEWTPDLSVGVDKIDEQHRELFKRITSLVEAIKSKTCKFEIGPTTRFLEEYVLEHFSDEEDLMRSVDYPAYEQHKALHRGFIDDFEALARELEGESSSYNKSAYTNKIVVDWILAHIKKVDMELGSFISSKKGA
jgi:hemerythrin